MNINKKGIRVLAIAESFKKEKSNSILTGVVMRKDFIIDGVIFGKATIGGTDATHNIIAMFQNLQRNDIGFLLLDGMIISMFNIVDGEIIYNTIGIPVIIIKSLRTIRSVCSSCGVDIKSIRAICRV